MSEWLTESEIMELEEGQRIEVIWSGGNGPHEYVMHWDNERPHADLISEDRRQFGNLARTYNPLAFVGQERFHTRVRALGDEG